MTDDKTTIATLTAQLAEARAMAGAVLERAAYECAELAEHNAEERNWRDGARQARQIAARIRALNPDASAALAEYVRPLIAAAEERGRVKGLREAAGLPPYDSDGDPSGTFDRKVFVKIDSILARIPATQSDEAPK